jgi:hypothetical protein
MHIGLHHLSYCSNIHPGESWPEHFAQLKAHVPKVKEQVSPDAPFGIGLRLSALAAEQLLQANYLEEFQRWLQETDTYVFTINGFPYGQFHHAVVKDQVHEPDWTTPERLLYTQNLATILAQLIAEGETGTISTSPISYQGWFRHSAMAQLAVMDQAACQLAEMALFLHRLKVDTGKQIELSIEPEPAGLVENLKSTLAFFKEHLWQAGVKWLEKENIDQEKAIEIIQTHIGVCLDTCHFSVMFEDSANVYDSLLASEIKVNKVQISAAPVFSLNPDNCFEKMAALQKLNEPVYLHQVCCRDEEGLTLLFTDIAPFFEYVDVESIVEARTHFHIPLYAPEMSGFGSSANETALFLQHINKSMHALHFEVETYTWDVLPQELKQNLDTSISKELQWAINHLK